MPTPSDGCVGTARGPLQAHEPAADVQGTQKEVARMTARVGAKAPDFEASAYIDGGFKNLRLSDFLGQWVVLCFYPGDFTFV